MDKVAPRPFTEQTISVSKDMDSMYEKSGTKISKSLSRHPIIYRTVSKDFT